MLGQPKLMEALEVHINSRVPIYDLLYPDNSSKPTHLFMDSPKRIVSIYTVKGEDSIELEKRLNKQLELDSATRDYHFKVLRFTDGEYMYVVPNNEYPKTTNFSIVSPNWFFPVEH